MAISKKIRFEVFKRDNFKCLYCGKNPPECILEIDHIIPKSKDGKDEISNLVSSCFDCNRGKGNREIQLKIIRPDIKKINQELANQIEEMNKYYGLQKEIIFNKEKDLKIILNYWYKNASSYISDKQVISLRRFLNEFPPDKIIEAIGIACGRVYGWSHKFRYMCGILHNWRKEKSGLA